MVSRALPIWNSVTPMSMSGFLAMLGGLGVSARLALGSLMLPLGKAPQIPQAPCRPLGGMMEHHRRQEKGKKSTL